ncbi:TPA: winged helix-turn-helix domain-containing protein [Salmonella enterica subsp. enterica serovar Enteritidis]
MVTRKITDEQLQQELNAGLGPTEIAKKYNMSRRNVLLRSARLAKKGVGHGRDVSHLVPDGYKIKGTSSLVDEFGNTKLQWVKTDADAERQVELMRAVVDEMKKDLPKYKPVTLPKNGTDDDLLNLYTITDHHIGMLACREEGGDDYDTTIAESLAVDWFNSAVCMSPQSGECIINFLGDQMHYDGMKAMTPMSGHILSADSRLFKMIRTAIKVIKLAVSLCLRKHKKVKLLICEGNHDLSSSLWLREMFYEVYTNEPRVEVNREVSPYYAYKFGDCMISAHHGHCSNFTKVEQSIIGKYREMYGQCKFTYVHTGHLHHRAVKETNLLIVEQHQTLAAKDEYSSKGGYYSGRSANVITYHKRYGEVSRISIPVEMLRDINPKSTY